MTNWYGFFSNLKVHISINELVWVYPPWKDKRDRIEANTVQEWDRIFKWSRKRLICLNSHKLQANFGDNSLIAL